MKRLEVKMPVYRITKRDTDGAVMETEYVEDRWVPAGVYPGMSVDKDPDLRFGTPERFENRRVE